MLNRRSSAVRLATLTAVLVGALFIGVGIAATGGTTTYSTAGSAVVDGVSSGPWNTSQGDPSEGGSYPADHLFPTYTPGGAGITTVGGVIEPNLAVYPGASSGGSPASPPPYASGVAGTPGPLDGYCSSLGPNPQTGPPVGQPSGVLPFAPYYFPDVVRNANGSLTGYFDYRPKDADEAITVARSTDGKTWSTEGDALDQNQGYCPTADTNDDGQGHPYVMALGAGGPADLYTLQRPAGDNTGVGLLVHPVDPAAGDPLAGDPQSESVGVDPNTLATASVSVPAAGGTADIDVSSLGTAGSPDQIVAGPYEDLNAPTPWTSIITCLGTGSLSLTGCTVAGSTALTVNQGDDLVQVIATANPKSPATSFVIPQGPNTQDAAGGLATLNIANANPTVSPISTYLMNLNAPNRVYIDGATVYCAQSNANPTNKLENCTTPNPGGLTVQAGDAITADPITPPSARMTTGLLAPDGIVGTLPSYPGASAGATVVLYTEKVLSYYIVGTTNAKLTLPVATINY